MPDDPPPFPSPTHSAKTRGPAPKLAAFTESRLHAWFWGGAILLAVVAVYHGTLNAEFVFDDRGAIMENPTIRRLWPPADALSPPINGLPVTGRPITNLSFALNYATHGLDVRGYRATNLAIHAACALVLFGIVRRTLRSPRLIVRFGPHATMLAGASALLWTVHPLATAAVTYVSQRAESLGSLFLLLSLYAFIRHRETSRHSWSAGSLAACWLGIATKEFNFAIPLLLATYDRLFFTTSWRDVFRPHAGFYSLSFASWIPLAWLILGTENRGGTWAADAGFTPWEYVRLQAQALLHYLRLVVWPDPLVFDYGRNLTAPPLLTVIPHAIFIFALIIASLLALRRNQAIAFPAVAFFVILAPTTSFVPIADPMFEHRMYLPAALVLTTAVLAGARLAGPKIVWLVALLIPALGATSVIRNADYRTALGIWQDTVEKRPANARALNNLGQAMLDAGRTEEAVAYLEKAYKLTPNVPVVVHDLAVALDFAGRRTEAIARYRESLRLAPANILTQLNLANALAQTDAPTEALQLYEDLIARQPRLTEAHLGRARTLLRLGRTDEAIAQFHATTRLAPENAELFFNLGDALARAGRLPDAIPVLREAVELDPQHVPALTNLGNALLLTRQPGAAGDVFRRALELTPNPMIHTNLGYALLMEHRATEARTHFEAALKLDPEYKPARDGLARATVQ